MADRLVVGVLGNQNSGKSKTWYTLFGDGIRATHRLRWWELRPGQWVQVGLVGQSPEESRLDLNGRLDVFEAQGGRIVLCSMQYVNTDDVTVLDTLRCFIDRDYTLYVQWLNPGRKGSGPVQEDPAITDTILGARSALAIRDGNADPHNRVEEIKEFVYGWAKYRHPRFS